MTINKSQGQTFDRICSDDEICESCTTHTYANSIIINKGVIMYTYGFPVIKAVNALYKYHTKVSNMYSG